MLRLGQKVIIVADRFEQNLPIGSYGYIIAYDKNPDTVYDYIVRVPSIARHFYMPRTDVELEQVLIKRAAEQVEKEALIDYALATKNESLFHSIMNEGEEANKDAEGEKSVSNKEFMRQVHLKAWI